MERRATKRRLKEKEKKKKKKQKKKKSLLQSSGQLTYACTGRSKDIDDAEECC